MLRKIASGLLFPAVLDPAVGGERWTLGSDAPGSRVIGLISAACTRCQRVLTPAAAT